MSPKIFFLFCFALAFAPYAQAASESSPLCTKWLAGSPIYETLLGELDLNGGLELDVAPLEASKKHQNSVGSLISERTTPSLIEKQMRALAELLVRNPNAAAIAEFRKSGVIYGFGERLTPAEPDAIMASKQRLERVINFGLRAVHGFAELSPTEEGAYFRLLLDESSAFLANLARPHRVVSRVPQVKDPRLDDFYIELRDSRGTVVGKYDPIEAFKQLFELRKMIPAERPEVNVREFREARIKMINEKLEAARQRVARHLRKSAETGTSLDQLIRSLQTYKAEALTVTVERLPETNAYELDGKTIQPGHYVLRFHDKVTDKVELRAVNAESLRGD